MLLLGLLRLLGPPGGPSVDASPRPAAPPRALAERQALPAGPFDPGSLRLNQLQVKGTHNSYHIATDFAPPPMGYTMAALGRQLDQQGVRQIELDVHRTPRGEFVVHHLPRLDEQSTCRLLSDCLGEVRSWSDQHPGHQLLYILIEPKDDVDEQALDRHLGELERTIEAAWPRSRTLLPADVRGASTTLRQAISERGWPTVAQSRDRALFLLLDQGRNKRSYAAQHPTSARRLFFTIGPPCDDETMFVEFATPIGHEAAIRQAVEQGYLVRTRADANCVEALDDDRRRAEAALASGAQLISTDFPEAVDGQGYCFDMPQGSPSRCNPLNTPAGCTTAGLELPLPRPVTPTAEALPQPTTTSPLGRQLAPLD